jgi:hypothetical protein
MVEFYHCILPFCGIPQDKVRSSRNPLETAMHVVAMITVITVEQPILLEKSEISKHVLLNTHKYKK